MIAFAALIAQGPEAALAAHPDPESTRRLLSGQRPKRLAPAETLMLWAAEATATPPFLLAACLVASGDKAEVASLLLPPATGIPPSLAECLTTLETLAAAPESARRDGWLTLAHRLPPDARLIFTRLAAGTFRQTLRPAAEILPRPATFRAILTMLSPQGPEATFALRHGNGLVPIAKLRLDLPETPEILAWARSHVLDRFGPNLQLQPDLVFDLACDGTTPNARRKSGLDLAAPRLLAWVRDATPDQATTLDQFKAPDPFTLAQIPHGGDERPENLPVEGFQ